MAVNVNIVGRLGKDAEVINGQNGQFLSFSLATDEFKNGKRGTAWLQVNYNNTKMAEWLKKGKMVTVIGTETVRTYQDRNGQTQVRRDINAVSVEFVNVGSGQTQSDSTTSNETKASAPITTGHLAQPKDVTPPTNSSSDQVIDDLPF